MNRMSLGEWFLDLRRVAWVRFDAYHLDAYVRKTKRYLGGHLVKSFDLASFSVDESERGKGYFTRFLSDVERMAVEDGYYVYIESVLDRKLYDFLCRSGYRVVESSPDCLYKTYEDLLYTE